MSKNKIQRKSLTKNNEDEKANIDFSILFWNNLSGLGPAAYTSYEAPAKHANDENSEWRKKW
jgi:hypothetical protein